MKTLFFKLVPTIVVAFVTINHHRAIIQVEIGKNAIEDVWVDGGFKVNIIIEKNKS